jgi:hypothetical protein
MFRVWEEGQRVLLDVFSHTTLSEVALSKPSAAFFARSAAIAEPAAKQ